MSNAFLTSGKSLLSLQSILISILLIKFVSLLSITVADLKVRAARSHVRREVELSEIAQVVGV